MKWLAGVAIACLLAGLLIGLARQRESDPEAVRLLNAAIEAPSRQDYTAKATTFASYGNDILHSEAMVYNGKGGHSRIEYRLGSMSGVIAGRTGKGIDWRFDPLKRHMIAGIRPTVGDPKSSSDLELVLDNYRATVEGRTEIAGRPCTEVLLRPKSGAGGSRSLWIDNETGVILRSEERNAENELVAATRYSSIQYGQTATPDMFLPIPPGSEPVQWHAEDNFANEVTPEAIEKALGIPHVQPKYLPAGFKLEGHYIYRCPGCDTKTAVSRYVNGLNSLSVVQAPEDCEQHMVKKPLDFGLGKVVFAKKGPSYFWVMGELPQQELEKVSQSLEVPAVAKQ
ncbi:MAG: hypothetical protein KY468_09860 [Armatimonadetes bacterium]|nr:hypothetical protein [Armatimonadota bacterium]